jgi:hypothetical protein
MKNQKLNYFLLFGIAVAFALNSCSARKAEKNRTEDAVKTETSIDAVVAKKEESNIKKTEKTTVDDKTETTIIETVCEPIDPTKPAIVTDSDGKETILMNSKKTTRETTQKNNVKTDNLVNTVINTASEALEKIKSESKSNSKKKSELIKIDKKVWNVWNLLWLLIPVAVIYWVWKNKTKIIGWFI